jgi:hypothetical protein
MTYGYCPAGITTCPPGEKLRNGLVFCRIDSWLTGRRLISLPFSDHCEPLLETEDDAEPLTSAMKDQLAQTRGDYLEIRSVHAERFPSDGSDKKITFCLHHLDLRPSLEEVFAAFHKSCIQRKITRAGQRGVRYEEGRSEALLREFYNLHVLTRRRHGVPPQPITWFRNVLRCMGDGSKIRLASARGQTIAAILTVKANNTIVYKYGGSLERSNLGGTHLLFWETIKEAKQDGLVSLDLGRTDWDNAGLLTFKDRWGARRSTVTNWTYPARPSQLAEAGPGPRLARAVLRQVPTGILRAVGSVMYKHVG